jgi:long-chain acyl-CoA synthetase
MDSMRIFDILYYQKEKYPKVDSLASKVKGVWHKISTDEFISTAENLAYGFIAAGITKGDKIASICSNNRTEWNFVDMATLMTGAVHVPIYPTISDDDYHFIFTDAEVKYVFVSDEKLYDRIKVIAKNIPTIKNVHTFDEINGAPHWKEMLDMGEKNPCPERLESIKKSINAADLATLIYTSGTTGTPKGVMLSHTNLVSNVLAARVFVPVTQTGRALSFLPLCHVYERMLNYLYQYLGIAIYYAESIDAIGDNLKEVKPDIFVAVPRVLEKIYDKVLAAGNALTGIKKKLFFWAVNLGVRFEMNHANGWWYDFQLGIARKLVFKKWQEAIGGNLKVIASGSAPLQPRLQRVFWAAGIPVLEGYGLTETSPVISVNTLNPGEARFGTVGPLIPGVEVKIADDGEILCKGPNVMMGYYKRPDLTMESIDRDGWFHTGDIGVFKDNKFLMITDRKKELLKTSGGKYVAPQPIENKMKESPYISQIMVVGDGRKFTGALIVPNFHNLEEWCKANNVEVPPSTSLRGTKQSLIQNDKVHALYEAERDRLNVSFGHVEQIKRFELLPDEWTVETGEMTPKLKLKRKIILDKYKFSIEKIYAE